MLFLQTQSHCCQKDLGISFVTKKIGNSPEMWAKDRVRVKQSKEYYPTVQRCSPWHRLNNVRDKKHNQIVHGQLRYYNFNMLFHGDTNCHYVLLDVQLARENKILEALEHYRF